MDACVFRLRVCVSGNESARFASRENLISDAELCRSREETGPYVSTLSRSFVHFCHRAVDSCHYSVHQIYALTQHRSVNTRHFSVTALELTFLATARPETRELEGREPIEKERNRAHVEVK